jgi:hypothetical protein
MPWIIGGAMLGSALLGGAASSKAAKAQTQAQREASDAQAEATRESIAAQERMFERQVALQEPFRRVGVNALPELVEASRYTPFGMEQFQQDPGYGFRLKEGLRALESSAAARGGLMSGNQMRGITRYGQELGSQEFGNAFNRYQLERQARLGPLQSLAGMSQSSANTLTGAAGNLGAGMASTYGQMGQNLAQGAATMGNIRASGYIGQANALTGALGQGLNYYQNQQMMDRFFPRQGGGGPAPLGMPGNPFPYDVTP